MSGDAAQPKQLVPGSVLVGCTLKGLIGVGLHGWVYAAAGPHGESKALKLLPASGDADVLLASLSEEWRRQEPVRGHPHIHGTDAPVLTTVDGLPWIVLAMPLAASTFRRWIDETSADIEARRTRGLELLSQAAQGLAVAHAHGLTHLGLKPENLLLTETAGREPLVRGRQALEVRIADLGLSRVLQPRPPDPGMTRASAVVPWYAAPEQLLGPRQADHGPATDIYAWGVMLFELLDGHRPFEGTADEVRHHHLRTPPPRLSAAVPRRLDDLVTRCLAKDAGQRPHSMDEVVRDLREAVEDAGKVAAPAPLAIPQPEAGPRRFGRLLSSVVGIRARAEREVRLVQRAKAAAVSLAATVTSGPRRAAAQGGTARGRTVVVPRAADREPPRNPVPGQRWINPIDGCEMVWVPPGEFVMGSPTTEWGRSEDEEPHRQVIRQGFWMDVYPVTHDAYQRFLLANPAWRKAEAERIRHDGDYLRDWQDEAYPMGRGRHPVTGVCWYAARAYAAWAGKRLPTEAEWEYAARAGTSTAYWWGEQFDATRAVGAGRSSTASVDDPQRANPWGLVDMLGNVWEWTASAYRPYPYDPEDGREDEDSEEYRVGRGGAWVSAPELLRAACRNTLVVTHCGGNLGFRCVG